MTLLVVVLFVFFILNCLIDRLIKKRTFPTNTKIISFQTYHTSGPFSHDPEMINESIGMIACI